MNKGIGVNKKKHKNNYEKSSTHVLYNLPGFTICKKNHVILSFLDNTIILHIYWIKIARMRTCHTKNPQKKQTMLKFSRLLTN